MPGRVPVGAGQPRAGELLEGNQADQLARPSPDDLGALAGCLADGVEHLARCLDELDQCMQGLQQRVRSLKSSLGVMRTLGQNGRIEAARSSEAGAVVNLFHTMAEQVARARVEVDELGRISTQSFRGQAAAARQTQHDVATIRRHVAELSGSASAA